MNDYFNNHLILYKKFVKFERLIQNKNSAQPFDYALFILSF
jgi:hypothetical protein